MESLFSEVGQARRYLSKKGNVEDLSDGLCYLLRVKNAYPELIIRHSAYTRRIYCILRAFVFLPQETQNLPLSNNESGKNGTVGY